MRKLIKESGLRDISALRKRYPKAEIYFHQDLDGVTTAIAMILFGWLQEKMNPPGRTTTTMMPFWFGTLVGLAPWLAMSVNISQIPLDDAPDGLFLIMIVQAIFFFCFGLNQWLQYRGVGKWTNYM